MKCYNASHKDIMAIKITDCIQLYFLEAQIVYQNVKYSLLCCNILTLFSFPNLQYMTDGVLLRETLKDADLEKYRYVK